MYSGLKNARLRRPNVKVEEINRYIKDLGSSITEFGKEFSDALEGAVALREMSDHLNTGVDVLPREEVFLISSFVMNLQHSAWVKYLREQMAVLAN